MTNEELVREYQQGCKIALEQLIDNNKGMIYLVARRYQGYCGGVVDIEDLIQEGYIGMIEAAKRYDFNKSMFMTYALFWIRQRIGRYGKYKSKKREEISIHISIGEDLEIGDILKDEFDYICKVEDSIYFQELKNEIHEAMRKNLTLMQYDILKLRFGIEVKEMSRNEIAEALGIHYKKVSTIEGNALLKLRRSKWGRMKWLEIQREKYYT